MGTVEFLPTRQVHRRQQLEGGGPGSAHRPDAVPSHPAGRFAPPGSTAPPERTVPARPQQVWECIKPVAGGLRTKWDQNVKDFEVVE